MIGPHRSGASSEVVSPDTPKDDGPGENFFAWQGRREANSRQGRRHHAGLSGEPPVLKPAPLPRTDSIDVQEHGTASTTLVRRIRLALFKHQRGE